MSQSARPSPFSDPCPPKSKPSPSNADNSAVKTSDQCSTLPAAHDGDAQAPKLPSAFPSDRQPKTLILCFDGTSNKFSKKNTNVVKLYSLIEKDDAQQMCYYQPGIGTYVTPGLVSPFLRKAGLFLDLAFAVYLDDHIRCGYRFLMQSYRPGDRICLFGFSRGAYVARALAGMLHKVGLLPENNIEQIPFAYKIYKGTGLNNQDIAAKYKEIFCRPVRIDFLGVWDTVDSVGFLFSRTLPFTTSNKAIRRFRHALALDEHRARFRPSWHDRSESDNTSKRHIFPAKLEEAWHSMRGLGKSSLSGRGSLLDQLPNGYDVPPESGPYYKHGEFHDETDVLELWFAGCHADVGGGAVDDATEYQLSNISLRWMVREILLSPECGIVFDPEALLRAKIQLFDSPVGLVGPESPDYLSKMSQAINRNIVREQRKLRREARAQQKDTQQDDPEAIAQLETATTTQQETYDAEHQEETAVTVQEDTWGARKEDNGEAQEETRAAQREAKEGGAAEYSSGPLTTYNKRDATQPLHDQLWIRPLWWILEYFPTSQRRGDNCEMRRSFSFNLGRGRRLQKTPVFHSSVKDRKNLDPKYKPKAIWDGKETYCD